MAVPAAVVAAGWIPFIVVIVLATLFSGFYVRYFMSKYDSEISITLAAIFALTITMLTSALVPVDIFLVSYMKDSDGMFKEWANSSTVRSETENTVLIAYYVLYGIIAFCLFLLLPFMYFFYEEKDESSTCKSRCCSAMKYSIVCILIAATFLLVGAFVPTKSNPNANSTDWKKIEALFKDMASTGIEDALSFVISCFSLIGMLGILVYTAYGMSALPLDLVRGQRSVQVERMQVQAERQENERKRQSLRDKYRRHGSNISKTSRQGENLDEEGHLLARRERHLIASEKSWFRKCFLLLRPFEIIMGVVFLLLALLIFVSLMLTNVDKAIHSLGYQSGYALPQRHLPNPVDIVLVFSQKAFPLDYLMMVGIIMYFVLCSMSGIRNLGIWFLWIKMYRIRPRRTSPQGILMLCMILIFIVLAINIILYELTPQYSSFGSQHYVNSTFGNDTVPGDVKQCTSEVSEEFCVATRMMLLLVRFFYKMWLFGAAYYWLTWLFLGTFLLGFIVAVIKKRQSAISGEVDEDDFDESDDEEMIRG